MGFPERIAVFRVPESAFSAHNALLAHGILRQAARARHLAVGQKIAGAFVVHDAPALGIEGRSVTHFIARNTEVQVQKEFDLALLGQEIFHSNFF